jgi:hypothetical protein
LIIGLSSKNKLPVASTLAAKMFNTALDILSYRIL